MKFLLRFMLRRALKRARMMAEIMSEEVESALPDTQDPFTWPTRHPEGK